MPAEETLLSHALEGICEDRDCELHNIEVAIAEEVVNPANVAFWLAGWHCALEYVAQGLEEVRDEAMGVARKRTTGL